MGMLGNSMRGLPPLEKHLLYRACVLPIATYGFRLWFFEGAKNKTAFKILTQMQRKAALWITGAFRTSPTGGTEALAGLIPIHLHLRKLADCANLRIATLSDTHPIRSLLSKDYVKQAEVHHCSVSNMASALRDKVHGTIMEIENHHHELTERT